VGTRIRFPVSSLPIVPRHARAFGTVVCRDTIKEAMINAHLVEDGHVMGSPCRRVDSARRKGSTISSLDAGPISRIMTTDEVLLRRRPQHDGPQIECDQALGIHDDDTGFLSATAAKMSIMADHRACAAASARPGARAAPSGAMRRTTTEPARAAPPATARAPVREGR
jgi:hypothetical protein